MLSKFIPLLRRLLGSETATRDGNYEFFCPKCNHHKKKLEINPDEGLWHCWVCGDGGKSLWKLFEWVNASDILFDELRKLLGVHNSERRIKKKDKKVIGHLQLPNEFKPLWMPEANNFFWRSAFNYVTETRGLLPSDILKYGIGYCESGEYSDMLIIPSYTETGELNYFVTRGYLPSKTFSNPKFSRDVVGFDSTINWQEPIILVEGAIDAMTVRRNGIPLFGKGIPKALKLKIATKGVEDIVMCLDGDAIIKAINHITYFVTNGINVKLVEFDEKLKEDPNSVGYNELWKRIDNAIVVDRDWLYRNKIKEHLHGEGKTHLSYKRRSYSPIPKAQRISGSYR